MHQVTTEVKLTFKSEEDLNDYDYAMSQGLSIRPVVDKDKLTYTVSSNEQEFAPEGTSASDVVFYNSRDDLQEFFDTFDEGAEQEDHDGEGHSWSEFTGVVSMSKTYYFV